ncbi:hypothetical protein QP027_03245 [Corynebacterium breve]|uniref:DUF3329 domain-containing protein n=1 Tax=Corynebacterium breve TaxID=3049799 RepID=A0ABY8VGI6_9CORY|nr:gephyrin-like molybdotransferase receptor GlpR [Corynebacterium breve]WIM68427.1 hypothetical protein QP027_03245 [Corynebacterium breve]
MPGGLMILLIVVVWIFVLAPLFLGGNSKPIRRAGDAYEETRVLHEGGTEPVQSRRRPKLTAADVHRYDDDSHDLEVVAAEDIDDTTDTADTIEIIDDVEPRSSRGLFTSRVEIEDDESQGDEPQDQIDTVDGEVIEPEPQAQETEEAAETDEPEDDEDLDEGFTAEESYNFDESYLAPEDLGYGTSTSIAQLSIEEETEDTEEDKEAGSTASDELTEEEIAFAESRRGRGGWDPIADQSNQLTRYQRRQRTFIGLVAFLVVSVIVGIIVGGWAWTATVVAIGLIGWYLVALRNLVRQEQALRARRIRQLRRARLGVRSADAQAPVPRELRRPGAVIVEMDDESPDFDHLGVTYAEFESEDDFVPPTSGRRVG